MGVEHSGEGIFSRRSHSVKELSTLVADRV